MASSVSTSSHRHPHQHHHRPIALLILGWITIIFGIVLLAGGVWLIALGGSWYYAIAGLGLLATGVLLNMQNMAALWLYLVIWLGTLVWAWWEVGDEWWAQVPRMVAPTVLLIFILFAIPVLRRRRGHAE